MTQPQTPPVKTRSLSPEDIQAAWARIALRIEMRGRNLIEPGTLSQEAPELAALLDDVQSIDHVIKLVVSQAKGEPQAEGTPRFVPELKPAAGRRETPVVRPTPGMKPTGTFDSAKVAKEPEAAEPAKN